MSADRRFPPEPDPQEPVDDFAPLSQSLSRRLHETIPPDSGNTVLDTYVQSLAGRVAALEFALGVAVHALQSGGTNPIGAIADHRDEFGVSAEFASDYPSVHQSVEGAFEYLLNIYWQSADSSASRE